jgi:ribose 5-phosphate isomerase RpiB
MLDLTFDPSFARILTNHNDFNVLALPPDLQFGDLARLNAVNSDFY